jgi:hypothetical protein
LLFLNSNLWARDLMLKLIFLWNIESLIKS